MTTRTATRKPRDSIAIMASILRAASRQEVTKNDIIRTTNLNSLSADLYLDKLFKLGLMRREPNFSAADRPFSGQSNLYHATEAGLAALLVTEKALAIFKPVLE